MKFPFTRGRFNRFLVAASTACVMLAAIVVPLPVPASLPRTHTIRIDARTFAFAPGVLSVQRGDTVTLELEALDAVHGLYVDGYDVNLVAEPGKSAAATFVADKAGKFKFRCSVACGALHPFMLGELNVEPNLPFARALLITLAGVIGALAFFRK
jgi:heme/copper-type cytochrome/quinol oxidase subunit 2